jgi:hypothetical protein
MTERELERRAQRRLAVLRHVEEVSFNVADSCRIRKALWLRPTRRQRVRNRASRPSKAFEKFHHLGCQIRVVVDDLPAIGFSAVDIGDPMLDGNVATSQSHLTSLDADFISHVASRLEQLIVQADRSPCA